MAASLLPHGEQAHVAPEKLSAYVLNPEHPEGRHKARLWQAALGYRQEDWRLLRQALLSGVAQFPVTSVRENPPFGLVYEVRMRLTGPNLRTAEVLTIWQIDHGQTIPRFITGYPL